MLVVALLEMCFVFCLVLVVNLMVYKIENVSVSEAEGGHAPLCNSNM